MSASLVGSEMCIRDRCRRSTHGRRRAKRGGPCARGVSDLLRAEVAAMDCLLYTSDAADDM
eukprot:6530861-Alexandrium_andersonii.AAC.1